MLERAILDAALEQLGAVGWNGLTMEGVAAGAQTGKAAVYRRWPSKEALVADALLAGLPRLDAVPDLGSVREDLMALCRAARDAMFSRPVSRCARSFANAIRSRVSLHTLIVEGVVEPTVKLLREVVNRGIGRGEVRPDEAEGYVFDAIPAIMMYRTKMCGCEWNDRDLEEMIDHFMLPLLRPVMP